MLSRYVPCYPAILILLAALADAGERPKPKPSAKAPDTAETAKALREYYEAMSVPKPFLVRTGAEWTSHRDRLQAAVLECAGLKPLPKRVPLDVRESPPLDHPWCTVRRVYYQLWPGVYSSGLLFVPKQFRERPAPAMLSPHGHWPNGNAHPEVQKRCLNFARLGYVTFSSTQNHYEDLYIGVSHQTLMIWNNLRALDYLESRPDVDRSRIGVAGASGGGLQTQMVVALDPRAKAATIVGLTCDFREIMFPDAAHCTCNHFPGVMQWTDHPEISTLGLPAPVQYLTMNDWTRTFQKNNFPTIEKLYAANGAAGRVECKYFDTEHNYDKTKREETYGWMERWLRGRQTPRPEPEPETKTFAVETLEKLSAPVPENKGFGEISRIYRQERGYRTPSIASRSDWETYRQSMLASLRKLLGESATLPRRSMRPEVAQGAGEPTLAIERIGCPSEGPIVVPAYVVCGKGAGPAKRPVVILLSSAGKEALLKETGEGSPRHRAGQGTLVVLPDVRPLGELFSTGTKDRARQELAWQRNGIVWGRPTPGMGATDLRAVVDALVARPDVDPNRVEVVTRGSGEAAVAALFAAALDPRIRSLDVDLAGSCFEKRNLPLVSCVLQHGDVLQWAALLADRQVTLRHVPPEAGDVAWLAKVFAAAGNPDGLRIDP
ncbi:MAG: acetylxylan esterase [Thermoguttaceae bacterium]|nr:acetylxylan esterase [Thermoguttaceae bacterium]